jgi:hypothetical protein
MSKRGKKHTNGKERSAIEETVPAFPERRAMCEREQGQLEPDAQQESQPIVQEVQEAHRILQAILPPSHEHVLMAQQQAQLYESHVSASAAAGADDDGWSTEEDDDDAN